MTARKNETPEERKARLAYQKAYRARPEHKEALKRRAAAETLVQRKSRLAYQKMQQKKLRSTAEGKAAANKRKRKWRKNPEVRKREAEQSRQWHTANPEKVRAYRLKASPVHGVSRPEADAMIEAQGGLCAICGHPPRGKGHCGRLHVDHCHETGKIRAMLCNNCNHALGHMKDDPIRLRAAIKYLAKHSSSA